MDFLFSNPQFLPFLAAIPVLALLHFFSLRYARRKALRFANYELMEKASGEHFLPDHYLLLFLRVLTLSAFVLAASGAYVLYTTQASSSNYVFALDASYSMLADDLSPNRLEAAKSASIAFLDLLPPGASVGVLSFTGAAFVKQRMGSDYFAAKNAIRAIQIEELGGTAVGEALVTAGNLFPDDRGKAKVVVLFTDGRSNVGISVADAAAYLKKNGISVLAVGLGKEGAGSMKSIDSLLRVDEQDLIRLADATGGRYFKAEDAQALKKELTTAVSAREGQVRLDLSSWLILAAFVLVFLDWTLSSTRYRILP